MRNWYTPVKIHWANFVMIHFCHVNPPPLFILIAHFQRAFAIICAMDKFHGWKKYWSFCLNLSQNWLFPLVERENGDNNAQRNRWSWVQANQTGLPVTTAPQSVCHARLDDVNYKRRSRFGCKNTRAVKSALMFTKWTLRLLCLIRWLSIAILRLSSTA